MGKSTISMAIFNSFLYVYQMVNMECMNHYRWGFPKLRQRASPMISISRCFDRQPKWLQIRMAGHNFFTGKLETMVEPNLTCLLCGSPGWICPSSHFSLPPLRPHCWVNPTPLLAINLLGFEHRVSSPNFWPFIGENEKMIIKPFGVYLIFRQTQSKPMPIFGHTSPFLKVTKILSPVRRITGWWNSWTNSGTWNEVFWASMVAFFGWPWLLPFGREGVTENDRDINTQSVGSKQYLKETRILGGKHHCFR